MSDEKYLEIIYGTARKDKNPSAQSQLFSREPEPPVRSAPCGEPRRKSRGTR